MKRKWKIGQILVVLFLFIPVTLPADSVQSAVRTEDDSYSGIIYLYQKLCTGFAGSRGFHIFQMRQHLDKLTGRVIRTDYDFSVVIDHQKAELQAVFPERQWIVIHCEGLPEALVALEKEGKLPDMQSWWRLGMLFAIDGTLTHYVIRTDSPLTLHLYFRDVKLLRLDK